MRVGVVSPYSCTYPGGVGRHVESLADELLRAGHEVRVLAPCDPDRPEWRDDLIPANQLRPLRTALEQGEKVAVRASLTGYTDQAMLEECERGEDAALARYRKALRDDTLPEPLRALIQRQEMGVQRNHDQIKALRDRIKSNV